MNVILRNDNKIDGPGLPLKLYIRYVVSYLPEIVGEEDWPEKHEGCGAGIHIPDLDWLMLAVIILHASQARYSLNSWDESTGRKQDE